MLCVRASVLLYVPMSVLLCKRFYSSSSRPASEFLRSRPAECTRVHSCRRPRNYDLENSYGVAADCGSNGAITTGLGSNRILDFVADLL